MLTHEEIQQLKICDVPTLSAEHWAGIHTRGEEVPIDYSVCVGNREGKEVYLYHSQEGWHLINDPCKVQN